MSKLRDTYVALFSLSAALHAASACAPEEAYLTLQVNYPDDAQGKFGRIQLRRNSGPELSDGPFAITSEASRSIAIHAQGSELDAELELALLLCRDREPSSCDEFSIMQLTGAFRAGHTTALCFEFASLQRGRWPLPLDLSDALREAGLSLCHAP
jgi:hypothetical protein